MWRSILIYKAYFSKHVFHLKFEIRSDIQQFSQVCSNMPEAIGRQNPWSLCKLCSHPLWNCRKQGRSVKLGNYFAQTGPWSLKAPLYPPPLFFSASGEESVGPSVCVHPNSHPSSQQCFSNSVGGKTHFCPPLCWGSIFWLKNNKNKFLER